MDISVISILIIAIGAIFIFSKPNSRDTEKRKFYKNRARSYFSQLPDRYPYIVGWDGVDQDDIATLKTGPRSWTTMPMSQAVSMGYQKHPLLLPEFQMKYMGDFYMSINQMKQDFRGTKWESYL